MKDIFEAIIIGRGGQGAKSASEILAKSLIKNKYVQSFPEYGAERKGAPVKAYLRVSNRDIRIHSHIEEPDLIVIIDKTLINFVNKIKTNPNTVFVLNTNKSKDELKKEFMIKGKIFTLDADKIAIETIKIAKTNSAMLGAIVKASSIFNLDDVKKSFEGSFEGRINREDIDNNFKAIDRAYNELK